MKHKEAFPWYKVCKSGEVRWTDTENQVRAGKCKRHGWPFLWMFIQSMMVTANRKLLAPLITHRKNSQLGEGLS
jgi:hypothetical protein